MHRRIGNQEVRYDTDSDFFNVFDSKNLFIYFKVGKRRSVNPTPSPFFLQKA